jgi:hypothetical protein
LKTKRPPEVVQVLKLTSTHFGSTSRRVLGQYLRGLEAARAKREADKPLMLCGQRMSNWFYNVAQMRSLSADLRQQCKELCAEWDKLTREAREQCGR